MLKKLLIYSIILISLFACKKETIEKTYTQIVTAGGPEDIVLDSNNNRILVSCDERRVGFLPHGEIQQIDIATSLVTTFTIVNLPSIPFHPHGFDLQTVNGISYLYVINHYKDAAYTNSIIQFKVNQDNLEFIKEYKHRLLISPNDLTVLSNGSFYYSNDKNSSNLLEILTNPTGGSVGFCDGNNTWKKVDSLLSFPNGLYNEANKLYVSTSRNYALFTYDIQTDGSLQNKSKLSGINGMDNISSNGNNLIISVHPDEIKFALLSYFPNTLSPSYTYAIDKQTGAAKLIFSDDGSMISGSSTGVVINNDLYLAQVFDGFVLKISNYTK